MRFGLSSTIRRLALAFCAGVLVVVPATASGTYERAASVRATDPAVEFLRLSRSPVHVGDAGSLRFSWQVRNPRTLALVLNRWEGDGWAPVVTYVGGRFRGASVPQRSSGSRTFAQLLDSVPAGHWRATIWASFGEVDGGPGSVNRAVEFDVLPDE